MTTPDYIKFNISLGFNIVENPSVSWIINDKGYAQSFPTLQLFKPSKADFDLAFKSKCKFLLFRGDIQENNTFEYVYEGDSYDLGKFESKIRNQIRKGIKSCIIKDVDLKSITTKGLEINIKTLKRQKREIPYLTDKYKWEKYITNYLNKNDIYIKGAYVKNELIGYIIFIKLNNRYIIQHPFRDDSYSSLNPMGTILFDFINEIILKEKYIEITYGLGSFEEKPGLDKFKKGMLFLERPASRLAVISSPYRFLFNKVFFSIIKLINKYTSISPKYLSEYFYLYEANQLYKTYYKEELKS